MAGLADLIVAPSGPDFRTARVVAVTGHQLTVDLGGPVPAFAADSCTPRPNDTVLLLVSGQVMTAVAVLSGPYRQATVTVQSSTSTTVTALVNGVSQTIPKAGAFTVANGAVCPLHWAPDGSRVWCLPNEQTATSGPAGGDGSGGAPGGVSQGATTYPAVWSGQYRLATADWSGLGGATTTPLIQGFFAYGASRFRELQSRTIRYGRVYLPGSGTPVVWGHPHASRPAGAPSLAYNGGARSVGGWVSLPVGLVQYLVSGSGTGGLAFTIASGIASIQGVPAGAIEIGWRVG